MGEYIRVRFRFSWPLVVSPGRRAPRRQIWIFSARFYRDILPPILTIICDNTRQQAPINARKAPHRPLQVSSIVGYIEQA